MNNNTLKIFIMFGAALAVFVGIVTLASGITLISQGAGFNGVITIIGSITNFVVDVAKTVGNYLYANATTIEQDELAHAIWRGENPDIPEDVLPLLQQMRFNLWPVEKAWRKVIGEPSKPEKK